MPLESIYSVLTRSIYPSALIQAQTTSILFLCPFLPYFPFPSPPQFQEFPSISDFQIPLCPKILRTSGTHADDLTHPHCIPNSLYLPQMTHSFILFHLSLFLKIQHPTHGRHTRVAPHSIVSPAYASGNTSTRTRVLRPALLTLETFHHLALHVPEGSHLPPLRTPTPNNYPFPRAFPKARSVHLCAPFIPRNNALHPPPSASPTPGPRSRRVPPVPGSASRTLRGLRRGKQLRRLLLVF